MPSAIYLKKKLVNVLCHILKKTNAGTKLLIFVATCTNKKKEKVILKHSDDPCGCTESVAKKKFRYRRSRRE